MTTTTLTYGLLPEEVTELERIIGIEFEDKRQLVRAFTHDSSTEEQNSYQALEKLGDAVISEVVLTYIAKKYPAFGPDRIGRIQILCVSNRVLSRISKNIGFDHFLVQCNGGRTELIKKEKRLADVFEAVVGALRLDHGYEGASWFVLRHLADRIDLVQKYNFSHPINTLKRLLEFCFCLKVRYGFLGTTGKGKKRFGVWIKESELSHESLIGIGEGLNAKEACYAAAIDALTWLAKNDISVDELLQE